MTIQTYGPAPTRYELVKGSDEWYIIGSEIGAYFRLFRGQLYKKYPGLWRKTLSPDQTLQKSKNTELYLYSKL